MKKTALVLMVFLLLAFLISPVHSENLPAPFAKIKEVASKCEPDIEGDYMWRKQIAINGTKLAYLMDYYSKADQVVIGKSEGPYFWSVVHLGSGGLYVIQRYAYGKLFYQAIVSEGEACKKAYEIFREIVEHRLL